MDLPVAARPAVHRAGPVVRLLSGAAVPEPRFSLAGTAGCVLSHALQHHCAHRLHSNDKGELFDAVVILPCQDN